MLVERKNLRISLLVFFAILYIYIKNFYVENQLNISIFSDLWNYWNFFEISSSSNLPIIQFEPGFSIYTWVFSKFVSFNVYRDIIVVTVFFAMVFTCYKFSGRFYSAVIVSIFVLAFYTPLNAISEVALRQGLAASILLIFLPKLMESTLRPWVGISIFALIVSFHYSAVLPLVAFLLTYFVVRFIAFYVWLLFMFLYIINFSGLVGIVLQDVLMISADSLNDFNRLDVDYLLGFKWAFLLLSILPVVVALLLGRLGFFSFAFLDFIKSKLMIFYFFSNSIAMCFSLSTFHDRFFIWSWILIPVIFFWLSGYFKRMNYGRYEALSRHR